MAPSSSSFSRFLGIDVSKDTVTVFDSASETCRDIPNRAADLRRFLKAFDHTTLAVCETTGGHERVLLDCLLAAGIAAHRADAARVKAYLQSLRRHGKTDAIDARGLAHYARERADSLPLWSPPDETRQRLQHLAERRRELVAMRVSESNRAKAPTAGDCAFSFKAMLTEIQRQIRIVDDKIDQVLEACQPLAETVAVLTSIAGIGRISAIAILAAMPELGQISGKQIASLAGLAPHPRDSGSLRGRRSVRGGRPNLRAVLFMAALSAARAKGPLSLFYKALIQRGKLKMVALTAVARKLIVIANARVRDHALQKQS